MNSIRIYNKRVFLAILLLFWEVSVMFISRKLYLMRIRSERPIFTYSIGKATFQQFLVKKIKIENEY